MSISDDLKRGGTKDARQTAYQILKSEILDLLRLPGDKLSEAELAAQLDMSRTPVRDVLMRLTREHLVELIPQRGAFVSRIDLPRMQQSAWLYEQAGVAAFDMLYIKSPSASELLLLRHIMEQLRTFVAMHNPASAAQMLMEFHSAIYRLAGLELVWESLYCTVSDFQRVLNLAGNDAELWDGILLECDGVVEGLSNRSYTEAVRALRHQVGRLQTSAERLRQEHPACFDRTETL